MVDAPLLQILHGTLVFSMHWNLANSSVSLLGSAVVDHLVSMELIGSSVPPSKQWKGITRDCGFSTFQDHQVVPSSMLAHFDTDNTIVSNPDFSRLFQ
ncbi:hypothetical protein GE21DRAFT_1284030 [Neurospora crassa]|nr:hypothetical protein GE21DRAFT_1284030 [Neurospora crassa]